MSATGARELVYCHECNNEWYRNQHGLTCPECHSDFCEVIEQNHDPREEFYNQDDDEDMEGLHTGFHNAPDPDEGDVGQFAFAPMHSTFTVDGQPLGNAGPGSPGGRDPQDDPRAGMANDFTSMISNIMGMSGPNWSQQQEPAVSRSTQTSPSGFQSRTSTFSFNNGRMSYTSTVNGSPGTNRAMGGTGQPGQPDDFGQMLAGILGPLFHPHHDHDHMTRSPNGQPQNPLGAFFNMIANQTGGQHGDAVYSQEAFDRIISQMMEQNQAGNAPGPAPADEIAALPKKKIDSTMLGDNGKAECTICMDEVKLGDEVTMLYCGHWFHGDCVGAWLGSHDTCPHCRMSIEESKAKANGGAGAAASAAGNTGGESSRRSTRSGAGSRRSSTYSFGRRRSSTAASNTSMRDERGNQMGDQGSPTGSNSGGLLDRARNLFRGGPSA